MKQAILVVELPAYPYKSAEVTQAVERIEHAAKEILEQSSGSDTLGAGAWLISLLPSLPFLAEVVQICEKNGFPYKYTFLDDELKWEKRGMPLTDRNLS